MDPLRRPITTERLRLEPLRVDHAEEMVAVLDDEALYTFTGEDVPDLEGLRRRYRAQVAGPSDGSETWLNWIARERASFDAVGFVQATLVGTTAEMAWLIGTRWQRRGLATEATRALSAALADAGTTTTLAHIHSDHVASQRVAEALGLKRSGAVDEDGEEEWTAPTSAA